MPELVSDAGMLPLLLAVGVVELADDGVVIPVLAADPDVEFVNVGNTPLLLGGLDKLVMLDALDVVELVGMAELRVRELA